MWIVTVGLYMGLSFCGISICCVTVVKHLKFSVFLQAEGEDNLKKMQLMELAILNGTYRDNNVKTRK